MCHLCSSFGPHATTRRSFLKTLAGASAAAAFTCAAPRMAAAAETPNRLRSGLTGWARLVTPSQYWDVHMANDATLAKFIRAKTSFPIDPRNFAARPSNLDDLCRFPLIFTNDLVPVHNQRELLNLREYLYRGGFLYIDGCVNENVTPDFGVFEDSHMALFPRLLPGCQIRLLSAQHEIYRSAFPVSERQLSEYLHLSRKRGLFGVIDDDRIVIVFSLDSLQCGWPQDSAKEAIDMKQIANIYAYALAH